MINKKFLDTRTGEIVEIFNLMDIKYMQELDSEGKPIKKQI